MVAKHPAADVQKAKQRLVDLLRKETGFVGAGISSSEEGLTEIVVMITDATSVAASKVPEKWEGFSVRVELSGIPRKF